MPGMGRVQIGTVMRRLLDGGTAIDPATGQVNCTQLAEAAANEFGLSEVPDRFFEVAVEFDNRGLHSAVRGLINRASSTVL